MQRLTLFVAMVIGMVLTGRVQAGDPWVVYPGGEGPGAGKHIVLISGDEEYRSEEGLPQLGKILSQRHGFKCTVLFAIDPKTGAIDPEYTANIPGLAALDSADLMIIATRFRNLPDEQMKHIDAYLKSGKPVVGMRTATHAFNFKKDDQTSYRQYSWNYGGKEWHKGFGKQVLGETWVNHHGHHGKQSTRGIIAPGARQHPIARGIEPGSIWGPTDVYGINLPLPDGSEPIVLGQVLVGMNFDDEPLAGKKNDPMMPVAWTKTYQMPGSDKTGRVFTTTMGAATDLKAEGTRRMIINGVYWALGMEDQIPSTGTNVDVVGKYDPTRFGFGKHKKGVKPAAHKLGG